MLIDSEVKVEEVCDLQKEEKGNCQELWVFSHIAPVLITVDAEDKRNDQIGGDHQTQVEVRGNIKPELWAFLPADKDHNVDEEALDTLSVDESSLERHIFKCVTTFDALGDQVEIDDCWDNKTLILSHQACQRFNSVSGGHLLLWFDPDQSHLIGCKHTNGTEDEVADQDGYEDLALEIQEQVAYNHVKVVFHLSKRRLHVDFQHDFSDHEDVKEARSVTQ